MVDLPVTDCLHELRFPGTVIWHLHYMYMRVTVRAATRCNGDNYNYVGAKPAPRIERLEVHPYPREYVVSNVVRSDVHNWLPIMSLLFVEQKKRASSLRASLIR